MKRFSLFLGTLLLCVLMGSGGVFCAGLNPVSDLHTDYNNAIANTLTWATQGREHIFSDSYLDASQNLVGGEYGDWTAFGVGVSGYQDRNGSYLQALKDYVSKAYQTKGQLHTAKATDWHHASLAILALGGDPTAFGSDAQGKTIDLIADGTYNPKVTPLWKQGINGATWALIVLDSKNYSVPSNAAYDREDIIDYILGRELADGGFALSGTVADPDITAMTLQALAPYYTTDENVKTAVDRALTKLSELQNAQGGYVTMGFENAESTCQVLVALCALGIDPTKDSRFVKNGKDLLDVLMAYYNPKDGGFAHSFSYDPDLPDVTAGASNLMATDQCRYALLAYQKFVTGQGRLYDLTNIANHRLIFNDVLDSSAWYYSYIYDLVDQKILDGKTAVTFDPQGNITRAEFAKILCVASGQDWSSYANGHVFSDCSGHWAEAYINWANAMGVVKGTGSGGFSPNDKITREAMATMIHRYASLVANKALPKTNGKITFADDAQIHSWAKDSVSAMQQAGIINGKGGNIFDPLGNATRAEASKMISAFLNI